MAKTGLYLYGLIRATEDMSFGAIGLEHQGKRGDVRAVSLGGIAALVSDYQGVGDILPTRRALEAYNAVIKEMIAQRTIIPIAFGHLVKGPAEIQKMLKANRKNVLAELDRLDNKVEMTLRIKWDVENIFDYFMQSDPELAAARDQTFSGPVPPTRAEKMELGQMFEARLNEERERHTERVLNVFKRCSSDVKVNPPGTEKTVVDMTVLVDRLTLPKFESKVHELAESFPSQFTFDYNGPWAPFNFVEVELKQGRAA